MWRYGILDEPGVKEFQKGYRQSYTHADLPSLKKYLIYLQNDNVQCRYMFVQYVFMDWETQLTLRPHGNTKQDQRPYKRTMSSTMKAIKEEKAKPQEVMHAVIKKGLELTTFVPPVNILRIEAKFIVLIKRSVQKRKRAVDDSQTIHSSNCWRSRKSNNEKRKKIGLFVLNEQTIFLANKQQLLDVEQLCTNPESFSVFLGRCNVQHLKIITLLFGPIITWCWK